MNTQTPDSTPWDAGQYTRRGLRLQLRALALSVVVAGLSTIVVLITPANWAAAVVVVLCGVGFVLSARTLQASGRFLALVQPPVPRWVAWVTWLTYAAGPLVVAFGTWLLVVHRRAAP